MTNERHEKALEAAVQAGIAKVWSIDSEAPLDDGRRQIAVSTIAAYLQAMDAVIVPKEPTEEMIGAGLRKFYGFGKPSNGICNAYREMVHAVPNHFTNGE